MVPHLLFPVTFESTNTLNTRNYVMQCHRGPPLRARFHLDYPTLNELLYLKMYLLQLYNCYVFYFLDGPPAKLRLITGM